MPPPRARRDGGITLPPPTRDPGGAAANRKFDPLLIDSCAPPPLRLVAVDFAVKLTRVVVVPVVGRSGALPLAQRPRHHFAGPLGRG